MDQYLQAFPYWHREVILVLGTSNSFHLFNGLVPVFNIISVIYWQAFCLTIVPVKYQFWTLICHGQQEVKYFKSETNNSPTEAVNATLEQVTDSDVIPHDGLTFNTGRIIFVCIIYKCTFNNWNNIKMNQKIKSTLWLSNRLCLFILYGRCNENKAI